MKVILIEDEEFAARRLEAMIMQADSRIEIVAKLESVKESVKWLKNNTHPDLIFLDIHLEDDLSFAIFEQVEVKTPVIFTTAYDEYAIKAFKLKSIDYLLKPIVQDELDAALRKYSEIVGNQTPVVDLNAIYELITHKKEHFRERFSVTVGQKIKTFTTDEVAYFCSQEGCTFAVLSNGKNQYPLDQSLDTLAGELNSKDFFRINRQYLVRLSAIANVHVFPKSRLKLDLVPPVGDDTFVSLDKVSRFKDWLNGE